MLKKTNLIVEDSIGLDDEIAGSKRKIKRTPIHEELFKQFGVTESSLTKMSSSKEKPKHNLSSEWCLEIIKLNVENVSKSNTEIAPINCQVQLAKTVVLTFQESSHTTKFQNLFNDNLFKTINTFIEGQNSNPLHYNRTIIFEIRQTNYRLEIMLT
jgi:hypothetical protein